jgi:G protein-coupled receptor Mth (Methuselah protein)
LFKCCPYGEIYSDYDECKVAGTGDAVWTPIIYSPALQAFLEPGTVPPHWRIVDAARPKCNRCDITKIRTHVQNPMFLLFDNGSLLLTEFSKFLDPGSFCVDSGISLVCVEDNCVDRQRPGGQSLSPQRTQVKSRVRKCCGDSALYSDVKAACVVYSNLTTADNFSTIHFNNMTMVLTAGFPVCSGHELVVAAKLDDTESSLKDDGTLYVLALDVTLLPGEFCVEHLLEHPADKPSVFTCPDRIPHHVQRNDRDWDLRFTLYPIGLFLSAFFLAATLAAGCLRPSSHHMLHWKCQTGHVSCLLLGDVLLAVTQLSDGRVSGGVCFALGE